MSIGAEIGIAAGIAVAVYVAFSQATALPHLPEPAGQKTPFVRDQ